MSGTPRYPAPPLHSAGVNGRDPPRLLSSTTFRATAPSATGTWQALAPYHVRLCLCHHATSPQHADRHLAKRSLGKPMLWKTQQNKYKHLHSSAMEPHLNSHSSQQICQTKQAMSCRASEPGSVKDQLFPIHAEISSSLARPKTHFRPRGPRTRGQVDLQSPRIRRRTRHAADPRPCKR